MVQRRRLEGQDRGQVLALQTLDQDMKRLAGIVRGTGRKQGRAVDEDATGADLVRLGHEKAVRLLQLLLEDLARGVNDLQLLVALQRRQVPAETGGVARQLVGRHLEHHDDAGLAELLDAAIDEFRAHRSLAGADLAFDQDNIPKRNSARKNRVEPADAGLDAWDSAIAIVGAPGGHATLVS